MALAEKSKVYSFRASVVYNTVVSYQANTSFTAESNISGLLILSFKVSDDSTILNAVNIMCSSFS